MGVKSKMRKESPMCRNRKRMGYGTGFVVVILSLSIAAWAFDPVPVEEYKTWPNNWGE
jgi:hypothetical protein